MRLTTTLLLLCGVLLMGSCSTWSKGSQVISDAHRAVETLKAKAAEGKEAYDAYMVKVEADRTRFEQVTGPWDRDGDGEVSAGELTAVLKDTGIGALTDTSKRDFLKDNWLELAGTMGATLGLGWLGLKKAEKNKERAARIAHVQGQMPDGTGGGS